MAKLIEFKCPCCGGAIEFDSTSQQMKCPYCDNKFDVETLKFYDAELQKEQSDSMEWEVNQENQWQEGETAGMRVYSCKSCGGEIVGDETTAATSCPFCGNPVVMTGQFAGDLKPDCVIPFKIDKKAAKAALLNHYKGKKLLPKVFTKENHIDEIKGIYVPFWLFDAEADADIRFDATRVRRWSDRDYHYTETAHYLVTRQGSLGFANVPVDGDSKIPDAMMESIEPFNRREMTDFQTAYLAGYFADKYDVNAEESFGRANERIKRSVESSFADTVRGFDSVSVSGSSVQLNNSTVRYGLLPVWMLTTSWQGKQYLFAMNGQTGKLIGDLPVDKGIFWRKFGIYTLICSAAVYAVLTLLSIF